jgi:hypothetical protein
MRLQSGGNRFCYPERGLFDFPYGQLLRKLPGFSDNPVTLRTLLKMKFDTLGVTCFEFTIDESH